MHRILVATSTILALHVHSPLSTNETASFRDLEVPLPAHFTNGRNRVNLNSSALSAIYYSGLVSHRGIGQDCTSSRRGSATIFLFRPVHINAAFSFELLVANGRQEATGTDILKQLEAIQELRRKYPGYLDAQICATLRNTPNNFELS